MICLVCCGPVTGERYLVNSTKTSKSYVMHRTHFKSIIEAIEYVRSKEKI